MNIRNTVVTLALSSLLVVGLSGYKTGVDNNRTGAQLGDQGCGFCHATNDAHIAVAFELDSAGSSVYDWYPGVTYTVKLIAANTSPTYLPKFGFQLSTVAGVSATPAQAGTFTASGIPAGTGLRTVSGVTYLQQNTKLSPASGYGDYGTVYTVTAEWVAPTNLLDSVIFCGVVCAVNNNDTADAVDKWNMKSRVFYKHTAVNAVHNVDISNAIHLAPNPIGNGLQFNLAAWDKKPGTLLITDMAGRPVYQYANTGDGYPMFINTTNWAAGMYQLSVAGSGYRGSSRLVKE